MHACGGRIETYPLSPKEKQDSELLRRRFCHAPDSELLEQIPVLSENDQRARWQKWLRIKMDVDRCRFGSNPRHELAKLFEIEDGLPKIVNEYGIFALIYFFNMTELKVLFLFLGLKDGYPRQIFFQYVMRISRSYVSTILNKLKRWRLIEAWKPPVKGRAHGRQLTYGLSDKARERLEEDLRTYDFFRSAVAETVSQTAETFPKLPWRKDLLKTTGQTVPPTPFKPTKEAKP